MYQAVIITSQTINCTGVSKCHNDKTLQCDIKDHCTVICKGIKSCYQIPGQSMWIIHCIGNESCKLLTDRQYRMAIAIWMNDYVQLLQ